MKKIICCFVFCVLVVCIPAASYPSLIQFDGFWKNSDPNTGGITKLKIKVTGTNVTIQAWGKCHPSDCDMGTVTAYAYAPNVSANLTAEANALTAIFKKSFKQTFIVIQPSGSNRLKVSAYNHFTDNSRRTDYSSSYVFKRALTTQPVTSEDCLSYDPHRLRIENEGAAGWLLTDGRSRMLMLDNESDARKALALAKRYTKHCFIGRDNNKKKGDSQKIK
jgi:hypothetical protein